MSTKQPRKPTRPFGTIIFGKDGSVRRKISQLPDTKSHQEVSVAQRFCELLRRFHQFDFSDLTPLDERDHDASFLLSGQRVLLQITEITSREFELPKECPNRGDPRAIAFFSATSSSATSLDIDAMNDSLLSAIQRKLNKHYCAEEDTNLWLLIFSTSPFILTEYLRKRCSKGGRAA